MSKRDTMLTKDILRCKHHPGGFLAEMLAKGCNNPNSVWQCIFGIIGMVTSHDASGFPVFRGLCNAGLVETLSKLIVESRDSKRIRNPQGEHTWSISIPALAQTLYAMKLMFPRDPPVNLARDLNLKGIIDAVLKDPIFMRKDARGDGYRSTALLLFTSYIRVAVRLNLPLSSELYQVLSKLWASPDFGEEYWKAPGSLLDSHFPTSSSALAMAFRIRSQENIPIPGSLSKLTNLSIDTHFLRYTRLMAHKNLDKKVLMANLDFFICWTLVDKSPDIFARSLRESLVSQTVSCIINLDPEPSDPVVMFYVRAAAPLFWADMLQLGLASGAQNMELEKSINLGMVGWLVRYYCNLSEFDEAIIAAVDNIAKWIVAIARRVRTHRRRIVQDITESLRHTDRSFEDRHPDDAALFTRLQRVLPDIQQFQDSEMAGVDPCCFASGCTNSQDEVGLGLLMCSICRGVQYCSRKCQKANWKSHKPTCRAPT